MIIPYTLPPLGGWTGAAGMISGIGAVSSSYTMFCNVRTGIPGYMGSVASGDGINDDSTAINAALALCPNGQYVYIPTGNYLCNSIIGRRQSVDYGNPWVQYPLSIKMQGDGPSNTRILSNVGDGSDCIFFAAGASPIEDYVVTGGLFRGSTSVMISGFIAKDWPGLGPIGANHPSIASTGSWMLVRRSNQSAGFVFNGSNGYMVDTCSQIVRVTGIYSPTTTGGPYNIGFFPPLTEASTGDTIAFWLNPAYRCGIENLYVERLNNVNGNTIYFYGANECWISGVETVKARNWHIRLDASAGCEVRNCYVHSGWGATSDQDYGVGLFRYSCSNLIENNFLSFTRHAMMTEWGGQMNIFGYNYSQYPIDDGYFSDSDTELMGDMLHHGGNPRWNLWEGNVASDIRWDYFLGPAEYNTALRNYVRRFSVPTVYVACYGSDIQTGSYSGNLLGNVYGQAPERFVNSDGRLRRWGSLNDQDENLNTDPMCEATTYCDGEYPIYSGVQWNSGNIGHNIVPSLYLTGRPSFWTPSAPWPANGADQAFPNGGNPAYWRVNGFPTKSTRLGRRLKLTSHSVGWS